MSADEGALGKNVIAALSSRNVKTLSLRASTFESICYHDPDDLHILAKAATHATHLHMHHNMDLTVLPDNSFEWMGAFKRVTLTSVWDMRNHPLLGDMGIFEQYGSHIVIAAFRALVACELTLTFCWAATFHSAVHQERNAQDSNFARHGNDRHEALGERRQHSQERTACDPVEGFQDLEFRDFQYKDQDLLFLLYGS